MEPSNFHQQRDNPQVIERLCKQIKNLSPDTGRDLVEASLKSIIDEELKRNKVVINTIESIDERNGIISPLMVACDKLQYHCLQFFVDMFEEHKECAKELIALEQMLGGPLDTSPDHNNQAAHYSALSGCTDGIINLAKIMKCCGTKNSAEIHKEESENVLHSSGSLFDNFILLLTQRNSNGDTPCMMATFLGNNDILETWFKQTIALAKEENISFEKWFTKIRHGFSLENNDGNSCLSLSYCHGNAEVLHCLIQERRNWETDKLGEGFVIVTYKDIEKAKIIMKKVNALTLLISNEGRSEKQILDFNKKVKSTKRCLIMLQVSASKLAEKRQTELLLEEIDDEKSKRKNIQKMPVASSKHRIKPPPSEDDIKSAAPGEENNKKNTIQNTSIPFFTTLVDGTVVSSSAEQEDVGIQIMKQHQKLDDQGSHLMMQKMLRDRCSQPTIFMNSSTASSSESMAIMESLCLDASMLLFSPHRMAMELSPSQLDIIEKVLYQQLGSVAEARKIHERLKCHMKENINEKMYHE